MADVNASNLGDRSLIIHVKEGDRQQSRYYYLFEEQWREYGLSAPPEEARKYVEANVVLASTSYVFVNFDRLVIAGTPNFGDSPDAGEAPSKGSIVIVESKPDVGALFYSIPPSAWRKQPLPDGADSDAGVLVRRGCIVAAIPDNNVPVGTYCALINLAALK